MTMSKDDSGDLKFQIRFDYKNADTKYMFYKVYEQFKM